MHEPYLPENCNAFYGNFNVRIQEDLQARLKEHALEKYVVIDKAVDTEGIRVPHCFGIYFRADVEISESTMALIRRLAQSSLDAMWSRK